jgi:cytochrome oxidase Cu insertion factor (SCO1/SenC/PrrC family)
LPYCCWPRCWARAHRPFAQTPGAGHEAAPADVAPLSPRYLLMDVQGRAVSHEDFRGRFQLVSFGFISCPDVCPTTLLEVKQLLEAAGRQGGAPAAHLHHRRPGARHARRAA